MKPFLSLTQEEKLAFVLSLQEKRKALKLSAQKKRGKKAKKSTKKKKGFRFSDPACQAMFDMMPREFKEAMLKG